MEENQIDRHESITLTKNAKGDYQWTIKVKEVTEIELTDNTIARLKDINEKLEKQYGKKL